MTNPGSGGGEARRRVLRALVLFALACSLAAPLARAQPSSVRAQLSSPTITIGESVRLAIVAEGMDGELDASALEREFDVIGRSSSRDVQILNGERRSTVTWVLELVPREVGVFTVPAVSVDGVEGELVTLTVTEAPRGAARDVFVEASVDTATPWVQAQVLLTLRVFRAIDIIDGTLGEPVGDALEVRALGEDTRLEEERDGRRYVVVERRFALFPQRSGSLVVEPIALSVTVPSGASRVRGLFAPTRRLTRRTAPIELDVRPRPDASSGWWLPATDVRLEEGWSGDADGEVRVGEPLTRTVTVRGSGVLGDQLPDLAVPQVDGLAIYADDPLRASEVGPDGVGSTLALSLAVIPERTGTFELPAVTLDWFDVARGRTRTASLPARTLTVLPGERAGSFPPAPDTDPGLASGADASVDGRRPPAGTIDGAAPESGPGGGTDTAIVGPVSASVGSLAVVPERWRTLAVTAFAGWASTAIALVVALRRRDIGSRTRPGSAVRGGAADADAGSVSDARRRVGRAARDGDAPALARALLGRAALRWPDDPPRSLAALARRLDGPDGPDGRVGGEALRITLARLDTMLYGADVQASSDLAELEPGTLPARFERALDAAPGGASGDSRHAAGRPGAVELPPL